MICSGCGSDKAKLHTVTTGDGRKVNVTLCDGCYAALYGKQSDVISALSEKDAGRACPVCGATFADYKRTGLVGCAACYTAFREELMPAIRYIQQNHARHAGKVPNAIAEEKYDRVRVLVEEQARLREQISEANAAGDGAEAARLTVLLKAVNRELYGGEA